MASALLIVALLAGPVPSTYVPACLLEYSWSTGLSTSDDATVEIGPSGQADLMRTELRRVRNGTSRRVDVEVTIPTGGSKWVALRNEGDIDPLVGSYLGNVTLKGARCPTLFPTPSHMIAEGEAFPGGVQALYAAVAVEFQIGAAGVAAAAAPGAGSTVAAQAETIADLLGAFGSGTIDDVLVGLRDAGWADNRLARAYGAYVLHWEGEPRVPAAVGRLKSMGLSAQEMMDAMAEWDYGVDTWFYMSVQGAELLLQAGYGLADVAWSLYESPEVGTYEEVYLWMAALAESVLGHVNAGPVIEVMMSEFHRTAADLFSAPASRAVMTFEGLGGLGWSLGSRCEAAVEGLSIEDVFVQLQTTLAAPDLVACMGAGGAGADDLAELIRTHGRDGTQDTPMDSAASWLRDAGYDAADAFVVLTAYASVFWQDSAQRILRGLIQGGYPVGAALMPVAQHLTGAEVVFAVADLVKPEALARGLRSAYPSASLADIARWITGTGLDLTRSARVVSTALRLSPDDTARMLTDLDLRSRR